MKKCIDVLVVGLMVIVPILATFLLFISRKFSQLVDRNTYMTTQWFFVAYWVSMVISCLAILVALFALIW